MYVMPKRKDLLNNLFSVKATVLFRNCLLWNGNNFEFIIIIGFVQTK